MAGNWKMYKTATEAAEYFDKFLPLVETSTHCEIVVCPAYLSLVTALSKTEETRVRIGAQNVSQAKEGAFTGEVSAPMIRAAGVEWVIVGHSERRQYFGETDDLVLRKTRAALANGLTPIVCVGEKLEERESNRTEVVLAEQFGDGLSGLTPQEFAQIVIAYEPVWAIGTGRTATPEMAADAHRSIRGLVSAKFGKGTGESTRILYGGSVKPDNIRGLMAQPEIDGGLVGGASLDPISFASIVNF